MGTASILEVVWSLIAAVGCYFSGRGVIDAYADRELLKAQHRNGDALIMAKQIYRNERIRLEAQSAFLAIGIIAMTLRSPGSDYSPSRILIAAVLVYAESRLAYASFADRRDADRLLSRPREETDG